eukprot:5970197-Pleurochrysis_carterae.AAC.1
MAAWKSNASLTRERDQLASELRGNARRVDRSEAVASQALHWRREADEAANAKSQRKRTMSAYRTAQENLAEERRERGKANAECTQLRADLTKANVQLRAADELQG